MPPSSQFWGWMIINWHEDPCYMLSVVVDPPLISFFFSSSFFAYQTGMWCTMGTPTLCLENWAKNVDVGKKKSYHNYAQNMKFMSHVVWVENCKFVFHEFSIFSIFKRLIYDCLKTEKHCKNKTLCIFEDTISHDNLACFM